jgi:tetratricopeptide (TPR) repeat protein
MPQRMPAMPDATHRFFSARLPLFLVLALLPCLLSNSCASSTSTRKAHAERGLSASAETDYLFLVYQDLLREDRKDEAEDVLAKLAALHPSPDLAVELANLQWGQNQREKATATLEKALTAFPDARQLTFYLANAYQMRRMTDEACKTLERFLAKHPKDGPASRELASILLDAGKHREAADVLTRLPEADRDAMTLFLMAKAASGQGRPQEAIRLLRQAVDKDATLLVAWSDLALLLEKEGDLKGAEACYRKMEAMGEDSLEIQAKLVRLAIARKDPAGAMKLLTDSKKEKALLLDAMSAFIEAKYPKQARQALALLEAADPSSPDLLFYRAVLAYEGDHNPRAAMDFLAQVPPENPNYDKSIGFRIQIALEIGDTAKAQELARQARERFPDKKEFVVVESGIQDKLGQTEQASQTLKQALVSWPDDVDLLYRYGVSLEKLKRRAEARTIMEKIVGLDPRNSDALNYLGYSLAEEGRELDKALTMIRTALEKEPDNPFFLDSLAWALYKLNRPAEALTAIQKAIGHQVKDAIIWEHYGDIAVAAGRKDEAAKAYRTALDLGSETPDAVRKKLEAL